MGRHGPTLALIESERWEAAVGVIEQWVEAARCQSEPDEEKVGLDHCDHYAGCDGDVEITHCTIGTGDHCWFGSEASCGSWERPLSATDRIWSFFSRFTREPTAEQVDGAVPVMAPWAAG